MGEQLEAFSDKEISKRKSKVLSNKMVVMLKHVDGKLIY